MFTEQLKEGLLSVNVSNEEPMKLALCVLLQHLCDCQVGVRFYHTLPLPGATDRSDFSDSGSTQSRVNHELL